MRIGLLNVPRLQQGAMQLSTRVIEAAIEDTDNDYVVINQGPGSASYSDLHVSTVVIPGASSRPKRALQALLRSMGAWRPAGRFKALKSMNLDLLLATPAASPAGLYAGIPYICWIADVMHLYHPNLPEYSLRVRLNRASLYSGAARNSVVAVGDSELGRRQLIENYRLDPQRVFSAPFVPPRYVIENQGMESGEASRLLGKFQLPERFLFYPAQFWAHKNHIALLRALALLKEVPGGPINLVLAGSDKGHRSSVAEESRRLGLEGQVRFLGYVEDLEMVALYRRCAAVVFPSVCGPTNIPPLEAMALGAPLLCSAAYAMPEQVGDAGLLFDPHDPAEIAEKIRVLWTEPEVSVRLRRDGPIQAAKFSPAEFGKRWRGIIRSAVAFLEESGPGKTAGMP